MLKQKGFSLIEVMVAFLITGVGIMGAIGLQNLALQNNQTSQNQVYGAYLAYDMIDRIRANRTALAAYDNAAGAAVAACAAEGNVDCAPAARASTDVAEWLMALQTALGADAQAAVCVDSTPDDGTAAASACDGNGTDWVVKLWWDEGHTVADGHGLAQALSVDNTQSGPSFYLVFRP